MFQAAHSKPASASPLLNNVSGKKLVIHRSKVSSDLQRRFFRNEQNYEALQFLQKGYK